MEQSLKLKPSRVKWMLIGGTFVGLAVGMAFLYASTPARTSPDDSLIVFGFLFVLFGAGAVVSVLMLTPDRAYLLLTPSGFTIRTLFRCKEFHWEEVEEFRATSLKGTPWVVFTLSPQGKARLSGTVLQPMNKAVSGGDDNLPDTYGMSAEALAELLNQWKKRPAG